MGKKRTVLMKVETLELLRGLKVAEKQSYDDVIRKMYEFLVEKWGGEVDKMKWVMWLGEKP